MAKNSADGGSRFPSPCKPTRESLARDFRRGILIKKQRDFTVMNEQGDQSGTNGSNLGRHCVVLSKIKR